MKNSFLLSFFLFIICIGCNTEKKDVINGQPVVIIGKVDGESNYININFNNFLYKRVNLTQMISSEDKTFEFILYPFHAQDALLVYQNVTKRIFISPNDTLHITTKTNPLSNDLELIFSGKNSQINNEIQLYNDNTKNNREFSTAHYGSVNEYLSELKEHIEKRNQSLEGFIKTHHPSEAFVEWAKNDIIYDTANYLMNYKLHLFMNNMERNDSLFQSDLFPIHNEKALYSSMYGVHLWHYITDQYIQTNPEILKMFGDEKYYDGYAATIDDIIKREPEGIIKDIAIFRMITALLDDSPDDLNQIRDKYASKIENKTLLAELAHLSPEMKTEKSISYNESDSKDSQHGDTFSYLLEKSKKQLLYVDIWASWCGPCRAEMPKFKLLHNKIKDENIKIISICCNTKKNDWLAVIEDNDLPGEHLLLNDTESELLKTNIPDFQGFPTYLIMKDGKILENNADRPSSGDKILNKLKSYL